MLIDREILHRFCIDVMRSSGLTGPESQATARSLVLADLRGVHSHGVTRLGAYAKRVATGVVARDVKVQVVNKTSTTMLLDGGNGMGAFVGDYAMNLCATCAAEHGCGFAAVRRANHFGIAASYTLAAAARGMIGIAMSNAPASMVPLGGREKMFGTNPLSIAIPAGKREPLVLDMASSVVAQGKIILAAKKEETSIPRGWAVDALGQPTTDPAAALAGAMLPFGGAKGYAIALIIEVLSSALSGALHSTEVNSFWTDFENEQGLGMFIGALDVRGFLAEEEFGSRVDALFERIKSSAPSPGCDEVLIPGELECRKSKKSQEIGINLDDAIVLDLIHVGRAYGVDVPSQWIDTIQPHTADGGSR